MPISWNTVIFQFRSIFATDERRIMSGIAFHYNDLGNPIEPCFFFWHGSMDFPKTQQWKAIPNIILRSSVAKNQAKFENYWVLTNGHRIKITQSNLMILVSFSSAGVAWFEDVKRYGTFRSQAIGNPPFRFLWDTRYNSIYIKYNYPMNGESQSISHWCMIRVVLWENIPVLLELSKSLPLLLLCFIPSHTVIMFVAFAHLFIVLINHVVKKKITFWQNCNDRNILMCERALELFIFSKL